MEISLLKVLLNSISYFFSLSSHENINSEPVQKYYQNMEEMLKLIKPILDAAVDLEVISDELLKKQSEQLGQLVDDLRELFETWHPLMSKVCFVLQIESLISKSRTSGLKILLLLKSYPESLPVELCPASLEHCIQKFKLMGYEETSNIVKEALRDEAEGAAPSADSLIKIADPLNLRSNQELLIEAVALEKLKETAEQAENNVEAEYIDKMIVLVTRMHDRIIVIKQSQSSSPIPIPPDFCCPLSLELMTDPVIVASGQTYERAYIRKWIDLGLTVCPKTRQTLSHTNLIPNYTVKALIANWCESNKVKLPDPVRAMDLNEPSPLHSHVELGAGRDSQILHSRGNRPMSTESTRSVGLPGKNLMSSSGIHQEQMSPSHPRSSSEGSLSAVVGNGHALDIGRMSLSRSEELVVDLNKRGVGSGRETSLSPSRNEVSTSSFQRHERTSSASSTLSNVGCTQVTMGDADEVSQVSTHPTADSSGASGEVTSEPQAASSLTTQQREPEFPRRLEMRSRSQWRRPSERFVPRIVSSSAVKTRADLSGIETQVRKLVEDLRSPSIDAQREATAELRLLAKCNLDNRIVIANCGAINLLVKLLHSEDPKTQEYTVTALLNLSINDNNKTAIANAGAIEPLIHVLEAGTPEAKENSAATLFSLSVIEDNKIMIGRSGAIGPLVDLLGNGTPRGKKDAATALFNLSIFPENKSRILEAGAVRHLVELMDPAAGMVDKAVAVLANLATIQEGRIEIGQEGGIPGLVEVVELGSARGKENAAAALLQLCTHSNRFCNMVLQEGAVPPIVALSQSGTPRAKEKAQQLLNCFRNQRHGNGGSG